MYYEYFGFRQPPFRITPDTRLFYAGGERGAVLEALLYALLNGEGIVKVVGEVGSGKTMLCRMLEQELPERVEVVYLANPSLSPENTLHAIAFELGLKPPPEATRFEVMNQLQEYLLRRHSHDGQVVVFVEEAQSMPLATLEEIRLLSNLETQLNKLLQIVLFGQPELDNRIATPEIRQLKERITYSFRLNPFQTDDIRDYLNSRVRACGYRSGPLFDQAAVKEIGRYSRGLLRRINILADKALLAAYAENSRHVKARHVRKAAADSEFITRFRRWWRQPLKGALAGLAILGLLAVIIASLGGLEPALDLFPASRDVTPAASPVENVEDHATPPAGSGATPDGGADESPVAGRRIPLDSDFLAGVQAWGGIENTQAADAEQPTAKVRTSSGEGGEESVEDEPETAATAAVPRRLADTGEGEDDKQGYTIIEVGGSADTILSSHETDRLVQQLQVLAPETVVLSDSGGVRKACKRCRALIYRPLKRVENL